MTNFSRQAFSKWEEHKLSAQRSVESNQLELAEEYWWQAMRAAEDTQQPQIICMCLDGLADVYMRQGRAPEAESLFKESLHKKIANLGPRHPMVGRAHNSLALAAYKHGKFEEAESSLKSSLMIFQETLGLSCPEAQWSVKHLVALLHELNRHAEADEIHKIVQATSGSHPQASIHAEVHGGIAICEICHKPYKGVQCLRCTQRNMATLRSLQTGKMRRIE